MTRAKSYRLLCPIARALDRVGDRWSLLVLRDLHAGPARFSDLQRGLPGLASNLLSTRLEALVRDGLIERLPDGYVLSADGEATAPLLFELAAFGSRFPHPAEVRRPGNLRTVAVSLKEALRRVVDKDMELEAELRVDGEAFRIDVRSGKVGVEYGANDEAPLSLETNYEALIAFGDGQLSATDFARDHLQVVRGGQRAARAFLRLMGRAFSPGADSAG